MRPVVFGRYVLLRHLASGGMADVFLSRVDGLSGFEKLLVIKRLLPPLARDVTYTQMFLDEARLAASLQHANVVQVFDVGVVDGLHYMAMEYLHGRDLGHVLARSQQTGLRVPLEVALHIVVSAAAGLHHAHELQRADGAPRDIVHRDVSPRNLFVGFDGHVKVVDFGIAKAEGQSSHTRTGHLKGTLGYMSPEQARGLPLDRRTDVFALGVVLWELLTGHRPFADKDEYDFLRAVVERDAPPPSRVAPQCPPALDAVIARALARNRDLRFDSARSFQLALEELAAQQRLTLSASRLADLMQQLFVGETDLARVLDDPADGAVDAHGDERLSASATVDAPRRAAIARVTEKASPSFASSPRRRGWKFYAVVLLVLVVAAAGAWLLGRRVVPSLSTPLLPPAPVVKHAEKALPAPSASPAPAVTTSPPPTKGVRDAERRSVRRDKDQDRSRTKRTVDAHTKPKKEAYDYDAPVLP